MITNTRRLITLQSVMLFKNPVASACSAAINRAGRIITSVINRLHLPLCVPGLVREIRSAIWRDSDSSAVRAQGYLLPESQFGRAVICSFAFCLASSISLRRLFEGSGALLFGSPVTFGTRLPNRRFIVGELRLITASGARALRWLSPFGQGLSRESSTRPMGLNRILFSTKTKMMKRISTKTSEPSGLMMLPPPSANSVVGTNSATKACTPLRENYLELKRRKLTQRQKKCQANATWAVS